MSPKIEQISSIKSEKRSTGVVGLDFQLGGGIPKGKSMIVFGDALSGCELLATQFWLADDSKESSYLILDNIPGGGMIAAGDFSIQELSAAMKGEWVVVDSLSTVIFKFGIDAAVYLLTKGTEDIKRNGGNILFTMYSGVHSPVDEAKISRFADIFITLSDNLHGNEIERSLTINKIYGNNVPERAYPYNIMSFGIELSTTGRVV